MWAWCRAKVKSGQLLQCLPGCSWNMWWTRCPRGRRRSCGVRSVGGSSSYRNRVSTHAQQSHCKLTSLFISDVFLSEVAADRGRRRRKNRHGCPTEGQNVRRCWAQDIEGRKEGKRTTMKLASYLNGFIVFLLRHTFASFVEIQTPRQ